MIRHKIKARFMIDLLLVAATTEPTKPTDSMPSVLRKANPKP